MITNGDKIRSMTDEEIARYLNDMRIDDGPLVNFCKNKQECEEELDRGEIIPSEWCEKCLLEWIRKEAKKS